MRQFFNLRLHTISTRNAPLPIHFLLLGEGKFVFFDKIYIDVSKPNSISQDDETNFVVCENVHSQVVRTFCTPNRQQLYPRFPHFGTPCLNLLVPLGTLTLVCHISHIFVELLKNTVKPRNSLRS